MWSESMAINSLKRLVKALLYPWYEKRLLKKLDFSQTPHHIGIIVDGNRRWAAEMGSSSAHGHRAGGEKITEFLGWCEELGVEVVTLWLLSTDNLRREPSELDALLEIIENTVTALGTTGRWQIHPVGALELLPERTKELLNKTKVATENVPGLLVNVAIGYGGRQEVVDAVKSLLIEQSEAGKSLTEVATEIEIEHVAAHLYTKGQPDPDLVIRTSGEQRLSGFLLWQSAHSEFYFCEAYWPNFRKIDFLRAVRSYAARNRRFGI